MAKLERAILASAKGVLKNPKLKPKTHDCNSDAKVSFAAPVGSATPDAEYDVICGDECVATALGPTEDAWREAMHHAQQHQAHGDIVIWEVTRRKVWPNARTERPPTQTP